MSVNKRMRDLQMRTLVLILVAVIAAGSAIFAGTQLATQAKGRGNSITSAHTSTMFAGPAYLAAGSHGELYVASTGDNRVARLDGTGKIIDRALNGLKHPRGLAVDRQGNVYVAESYGCRITKLSASLKRIGSWSTCGSRSDGFDGPLSLAIDSRGQVYATSRGSSRIKVFSSTGKLLRQINTLGSRVEYAGMAVDRNGNIYLSDPEQHTIVKVPSGSARIQQWGGYGHAPGKFNVPTDIGLDSAGNVYVAEIGNQRIQKLSSAGRSLGAWGRTGTGNADIFDPTGLSLDAKGNVYVSGRYGEIQKLSPTGQLLATYK